MTEEDINYQLGASDVDTTSKTGGEFVPFQIESRAIFSTLAEDIYPSPKVGIREAITNAITATKKVEEDDFEPIINIEVDTTKEKPEIIIEDNGIGMTMNTIRDVVSYIGRSTVRDKYDQSGQFGMGFLALFSLCGSKGGFIMHTHSRTQYGEPISGIWKDGGFSKFEETQDFVKDMKGTRFEIYLREDTSIEEIREWVEDVAQWSRVPILYEDKTEDGIYSNEFGVQKINSLIIDDNISLTIDNKYYKAVCSPELEQKPTILLDVLIDRNCDEIPYIPFSDLAIRLKAEHPVIMDGEYEGKMVIRDVEYEQLPSERKSKYVPQRKIDSDIPITPSPTGTREKLNDNYGFWEHIGLQFEKEYKNKTEEILREIKNNPISEISNSDIKFVEYAINTSLNYSIFESVIKSRYTSVYSENLALKLYAMFQNVKTYKYNPETKSVERDKLAETKVYSILKNSYDYNFMFISNYDDKKAMRIHSSNKSYTLVEIPNSKWYDFYEDVFSWDKLKNVTENHPICENVDSTDIEKMHEQNSVSVKSRSNETSKEEKEYLTIHKSGSKRKVNYTSDELIKRIDTKGNDYVLNIKNLQIEKLVVFSSESDYYISNYQWMINDKIALVKSKTKNAYNELLDIPVTIDIDEYIKSANNTEVLTNNGEKICKNISLKKSILHIVPDELYNLISTEDNINKILTLFNENRFYNVNTPENQYYICIPENKINKLLPIISKSTIVCTNKVNYSLGTTIEGPSIGQCKLYLLEFENRDMDIINIFDKKICSDYASNKKEISSLISLLKNIKDNNMDLAEVCI